MNARKNEHPAVPAAIYREIRRLDAFVANHPRACDLVPDVREAMAQRIALVNCARALIAASSWRHPPARPRSSTTSTHWRKLAVYGGEDAKEASFP